MLNYANVNAFWFVRSYFIVKSDTDALPHPPDLYHRLMVSHSVNARFCENAVVVPTTVLSVQKATPFLYILPYQVTNAPADTLNSTV